MSLWESLYDIAKFVGAIPRLKENPEDDRKWNVITFDFFDEAKNNIEELKACARRDSFDEIQACSELETYAENLIGADEAMSSVTEPSGDGWIGVRSEEVRLTEDNGYIPTQYPIYKITKVIVETFKAQNSGVAGDMEERTYTNVDISAGIVSEEVYNTLSNGAVGISTEFKKGNTIIYSRGEKNIKGLHDLGKNAVDLSGFSKAIYHLLGKCGYEKMPDGVKPNSALAILTKITDLHFRVEYIPLIPAKVTVVKSYQKEQHNAIAYNQHAEVYDARALGRNMWGKAQSLGIHTMAVVEKYKHWKDIPKVGDVFRNMIVTNVDAELRAPTLAVAEIVLSEDFNRISEYVNVNSKYRQWPIPGDGIIERNLHYQNFVVIDDKKDYDEFFTNTTFMHSIYSPFVTASIDNPREITFAAFYKPERSENIDGDDYDIRRGVLFSCQSLAVGNSLMFNFRSNDNLSCGKQKVKDGDDVLSKYVSYCEDDGTLEDCLVELGQSILRPSPDLLPESIWAGLSFDRNIVSAPIFGKSFLIKKDPSEQLSFTYQVHFVSNLKSIIIGEGVTAHNYFVSGEHKSRICKKWILKKKISKFTQILTDDIAEECPGMVVKDSKTENNCATISVTGIPTGCEGWAMTDTENRLIIAENGQFASERVLFFNFKKNR